MSRQLNAKSDMDCEVQGTKNQLRNWSIPRYSSPTSSHPFLAVFVTTLKEESEQTVLSSTPTPRSRCATCALQFPSRLTNLSFGRSLDLSTSRPLFQPISRPRPLRYTPSTPLLPSRALRRKHLLLEPLGTHV